MKKTIILIILCSLIFSISCARENNTFQDINLTNIPEQKELILDNCNDYRVTDIYKQNQNIRYLIENDTKKVRLIEQLPINYNNNTPSYLTNIQVYPVKNGIGGYLVFADESLEKTAGNLNIKVQIYQIDNLSDNKKIILFSFVKNISEMDFRILTVEGDKQVLAYPISIISFERTPTQCIGYINITYEVANHSKSSQTFFILSQALAWDIMNTSEVLMHGEENIVSDYIQHPFLWRIEGQNPSYIYGTIHVNDHKVLALPSIVNTAMLNADQIFTEIDLSNESKLMSVDKILLKNGQRLTYLLPDEIYKRLDSYMFSKGHSILKFDKIKIWYVAAMLNSLDFERTMETDPVLDQWVYDLAVKNKKNVEGIETFSEQTGALDSLSISDQIQYLNITLEQQQTPSGFKTMTDYITLLYLIGDEKAMEIFENPNSDPLYLKITQKLLYERNERIAQRLAKKIRDNPQKSYFLAVGIAHYLGNKSIIKILEDEGFNITRVELNKTSNCSVGYIYRLGSCYMSYSG